MKKVILVLAIMLSTSIVLVSCKGEKKTQDDNTNAEMQTDQAADQADIATNYVYQCPMDCEDGKTYDKEGTCPVCKMALKKVEEKK